MHTFVYGDNVDTDVIIPARYLTTGEPEALAAHCMEDIDPGFAGAVRPGDVVVAGRNFGCGSSREHAPLALKACGVSCVVAASFARIFYRNAVNIGLPILECPQAIEGIRAGDEAEVELEAGRIVNRTTGETWKTVPMPPFVREIVRAGGLLKAIHRKQ
jgi:3-isopropylmalate dehydratase small subunit